MFSLLKKYWVSYGGFKALIASPFIWLALAITFFSQRFWLVNSWIDIPIAMLPTLLGFNVASYSVWLAFGNEKLNRILSKQKEDRVSSMFMEVNASFIHFILTQILCLILVVLIKTMDLSSYFYLSNFSCINMLVVSFEYLTKFLNGFVFFLFIYSLGCMFAAILGFIGIAAGLDIIYRTEHVDAKNDRKIDSEKDRKLFEILSKLEQVETELQTAKDQNNNINMELEHLRQTISKKKANPLLFFLKGKSK